MAVEPDGTMVDDFVIQPSGRIVNVLNAPSPAATSSLNIGKLVVEKLAEQLDAHGKDTDRRLRRFDMQHC